MEIRPHLDPQSQRWFDERPSLIREGPLYGGRWERYLRWMSVCGLPRRALARRLFGTPDLEQQVALWDRRWEGIPWRLLLDLLGWRSVWSRLIDEPGIRLVDRDFYIAGYIHRRFRVLIKNTRLSQSPYASLAFFGRHEYALPLALRPEHFQLLRERAGAVRWETASLLEHLRAAGPRNYSAYSLSDFGSYADPEEYRATWDAVRASARPGARVCERQFLVKRTPPPVGLVRDPELEAALDRSDNSFIYTFK
jgi:S-adenosylmethionine-diacylglycerol 3-amino-3-carboxypropyl transferase